MSDTPTVKLECFFDCSSPWTYLGFHNIQEVAARLGVAIEWRPVIVGGVFNKLNPGIYETRANPPVPAKRTYNMKDMQDWARWSGVTINFPPKAGHPVNAVKCMRACLALAPQGKLVAFATAAFEALWEDGADLADEAVLLGIAKRIAVDGPELLRKIATPEIKDQLWFNTNELMDRGGFGSPTFFIDGADMYFGNDRVILVEDGLRRALTKGPAAISAPA